MLLVGWELGLSDGAEEGEKLGLWEGRKESVGVELGAALMVGLVDGLMLGS